MILRRSTDDAVRLDALITEIQQAFDRAEDQAAGCDTARELLRRPSLCADRADKLLGLTAQILRAGADEIENPSTAMPLPGAWQLKDEMASLAEQTEALEETAFKLQRRMNQ